MTFNGTCFWVVGPRERRPTERLPKLSLGRIEIRGSTWTPIWGPSGIINRSLALASQWISGKPPIFLYISPWFFSWFFHPMVSSKLDQLDLKLQLVYRHDLDRTLVDLVGLPVNPRELHGFVKPPFRMVQRKSNSLRSGKGPVCRWFTMIYLLKNAAREYLTPSCGSTGLLDLPVALRDQDQVARRRHVGLGGSDESSSKPFIIDRISYPLVN